MPPASTARSFECRMGPWAIGLWSRANLITAGCAFYARLPATARSLDVGFFPGAHPHARGIEQPFIVSLAHGQARLGCQLRENRVPEMEDPHLGLLIGGRHDIAAEQEAV